MDRGIGFALVERAHWLGVAAAAIVVCGPASAFAHGPMPAAMTPAGTNWHPNYTQSYTPMPQYNPYAMSFGAAEAAALANAPAVQAAIGAGNPPPYPYASPSPPPAGDAYSGTPDAGGTASYPSPPPPPPPSVEVRNEPGNDLQPPMRVTTVTEIDPNTGNKTVTTTFRNTNTGMAIGRTVNVYDPQGGILSNDLTSYKGTVGGVTRIPDGQNTRMEGVKANDPSAKSLRQQTLQLLDN